MLPGVRPTWIVCEDGTEYLERFERFLGSRFHFVPALDGAALLAALAEGASGVILDLDFRRTPSERLVDEHGRSGLPLAQEPRRRLAAQQGILLLRLLRARGFATPVLLYADLDDAEQAAYLEQTLAPLRIVPSHEGLLATAARMKAVG
jgi:hypothetical protein